MQIETQAIHAGRVADPATGAVIPPIHLSTTFERAADGGYPHGYIYTRLDNPNRQALEECLRSLEDGSAAALFASGSAATVAIFQALQPGDHVLIPQDAYFGTQQIADHLFRPWHLQITSVDMSDLSQVQQAIQPNTRLIWIETPSNPLLKLTDIEAVAQLAHAANAICTCDNTWATPIVQQPLNLGADLVLHSTTKYLGGHGDVLGGAVITQAESEFWDRIRTIQRMGGAVPSPFECWLTLRGIQTLPCRMRVHSENALQIAQFLHDHDRVEAVHYPGLNHHPQADRVQRQMRAPGGMLSFQVRGDRATAFQVASRLQIITQATSLGSVESLIEHRASIEGPGSKTPDNLLRLSVGLEHVEDLIEDLDQALSQRG